MKSTSLVPYGPRRWCRFCQRRVKTNPSILGDATCPRCGTLIWVEGAAQGDRDATLNILKSNPDLLISQNSGFVRRLESLGGRVELDDDLKSYKIDLSNSQVTDNDLRLLRNVTAVTELDLSNTQITDAGVRKLARLRDLEVLELKNTKVTDVSLHFLGQLDQLEVLGLEGTKISDTGLVEIGSLGNLWCLDLENTHITGATFSFMPCLMSLDWLFLSGTKVNDEAIDQLKLFRNLKELWIKRTSVTWKGLRRLKRNLKDCIIHH